MKKMRFLKRIGLLTLCLFEISTGFTRNLNSFVNQNKEIAKQKTRIPNATIDTLRLDVVGIFSNRNPLSLENTGLNVTIISKAQISQMPVQSLNEVLSLIQGVDIGQRGPMGVQSDVSIRGGSFDQVLVLVDGVRMSDPQTGHHQLNLPIPLEAIDRIEVIRGSHARRYGLNALSGVINIITQAYKKKALNIEGFYGNAADGNSTNYQGFGFRGTGNYYSQKFKTAVWISSEWIQSNGYRKYTDFTTFRTSMGLSSQLTKRTTLNLIAGANNNEFGASWFYAALSDSTAYETVHTHFISANLKHEFKNKATFNVITSKRWNYDHYIFIKNKPTIYQNYHVSSVNMLELNGKIPLLGGSLGAGLELRTEIINSTNLGSRTREFYGSYIEYTRNITDALFVSAGIYGLYSPNLVSTNYPGIEFSYKVLEKWRIFGNFVTGQRLPTFTDLYYVDSRNASNPNLNSEISESFELGIRHINGSNINQLSYFRRNVFRMIDWVKDSLPAKWMPVNYNQTVMEGIEGSLKYANVFKTKITVTWNFCTLGGKNEVDANKISKNALNYLAAQSILGMNYPVTKKAYLTVYWRYIERNSINPSTYHLIDARFSYQLKSAVQLYVNATNLGNTQYREIAAVPLMPRWVNAGFKLRIL